MKARRKLALILLCLPLFAVAQDASRGAAASDRQVPAERLAMLARCINIDNWFSAYSNPLRYADRLGPADFALIKQAGFTGVRLTLAPEVLFDPADPSTPKGAIRYVDRAVGLILDAGLGLVFDPIHGTSSNDDFEHGLARDGAFEAKVEAFWESLARRYAALSTDRIVFEAMNEPHLSTRERIVSSWWPAVQEKLVAAIRRGAPENTVLATGERWGGIDGLLELKPLAAGNVVYSFHWYDPFAFTHQGAEWTDDAQKGLRAIPYPSSPELVAPALADIVDRKARERALQYGRERWDSSAIKQGLSRAAEWGRRNGAPVWCGEFGAYKKVAPPDSRLRWIADVRGALEGLGIGWSMWEYDQSFGFVSYRDPQRLEGRQVDSACLAALGLPAVSFPSNDIPTPLEAFLSKASPILEIPPRDWNSLWTRDNGAGSLVPDSAAPDAVRLVHAGRRDWALSSGYRIPVQAGDRLRLESRAALTGRGSLSLEAVAYDASGKVVDWSYGHVSPAARGDSLEPIAAELTVRAGIVAIEPRWSGSGLAEIRLDALRLERAEGGFH